MRHDWANSENILGYDPVYWRSAKRSAWACVATLAVAVFGFVAIHRWPETLEIVFTAIAFLALTGLVLIWRDMWDNRRYHPRYRGRFFRKS